jgi:signal transduction histidine kinase
MLSFRQRIFTGYFIVFIFFLSLIFPFSSKTVQQISYGALRDRADELIEMMADLPDEEAIIKKLKTKKSTIFFRVTLINPNHEVIFDSHTKEGENLGLHVAKRYVISHPEILQALQDGEGYYVGYSELLGQELSYMAKSFELHGKPYVVRIAFPYKYIVELTHNFEIGFLGLVTAVLLLFSLITWVIIHHLTNPIQQIIDAIKPYQEGDEKSIPKITIRSGVTGDEFLQLAQTLNSLSEKIRIHIDSLTDERNEKEAILQSLNEGVVAVDEQLAITYANNMAIKLLQEGKKAAFINSSEDLAGRGKAGSKRSGLNKEGMAPTMFDEEDRSGKAVAGQTPDEFMKTTETNGKEKSIVGANFSDSFAIPKCAALLSACQATQQVQADMVQLKKNGEKLYLQLIAAPKGEERGAVLVIQDQSPQYRILEMRKDFIANASHELKTPITVIMGFAETLCEQSDVLPKDILKQSAAKILTNCRRMDELIKDLLVLSDMDQLDSQALEEVELKELTSHVCDLVGDLFKTAKINLLCPTELYVLGVPSLIEMAIFNLVENAAKYSAPPADITVTVEKQGVWAEIVVADKGIGIPEEDLPHIFQRFYRVDKARSKKIGGSGLGLSIVETIVEKHQGKVSASSIFGQGSQFTIHLPLAE